MDALEFLSEAKRMCDQHTEPCNTCAANEFCGFTPEFPSDFGETTQMQKMVELVETWSKEHPHKTRQSVFLEQYPEAQIDDNGVLSVCPAVISHSHRKDGGGCLNIHRRCTDCRREFWMREVE